MNWSRVAVLAAALLVVGLALRRWGFDRVGTGVLGFAFVVMWLAVASLVALGVFYAFCIPLWAWLTGTS